jgi:hypothetical protein
VVDLTSLVRRSIDILANNPILLAPALILQLLATIPSAMMKSISISSLAVTGVTSIISMFLVTPFIVAGQGYMNKQVTLGHRTNMEDFILGGRKYFAKVLRATIIFILLLFLFGLPVSFVAVAFPAAVQSLMQLGWTSGNWVSILIVALQSSPILLLAIVVTMPFQILTVAWQQAVIVEEVGALGSFSRCFGFVRRNIPTVLGYSGLRALVDGLVGGPTVLFDLASGAGVSSTSLSIQMLVASAGLWLVTLVANVLTATFFTLLMFAVYIDRRTTTPIMAPPAQPALQPPQRVFCPSCGTPVAAEDAYCVNCGRKIR